jgi:hypothetical protein
MRVWYLRIGQSGSGYTSAESQPPSGVTENPQSRVLHRLVALGV